MNMRDDESFITKYQLFSTVVVTIVGVGIFSYPNYVSNVVGTDGWFVTLITGLIVYALLYCIYKIEELNNYNSFYGILKNNFGNILSKIISIFFVILNIILISIGMRIFAEVLKMYLLEKTPTEFIILVMIITGSYLIRCEIENLVKFNEISFWIMFIPMYIVIFFLTKDADFTNIFPVLHSAPLNYIKGIMATTFAFEGFEIAYLVLPYVKEKKQVPKVLFKSVLFITIFYALISIVALAVFGVKETKTLIWPTLTMIKSINIPGSFIEQWEGIVMTFWILFYITTFVNIYHFSCSIVKDAFKLEDIKLSSIIIIPFIYIFALYPENLAQVYKAYNSISVILPLVSIIVLIVILLIISFVKRRRIE